MGVMQNYKIFFQFFTFSSIFLHQVINNINYSFNFGIVNPKTLDKNGCKES